VGTGLRKIQVTRIARPVAQSLCLLAAVGLLAGALAADSQAHAAVAPQASMTGMTGMTGISGNWRPASAGTDALRLQSAQTTLVPPSQRHHQAQSGSGKVPLSVVLRNIRSTYPGKHLDTRLVGNTYKVIWLTPDGRRLDILADARSGNILSVRGN